ncbi:aspartic peptidase domain-containing protein [Infundibulicybe gibba]|nr:aspartic peptidase domain-containing protein [Infundibulicybe gibba]
MGLAFDGVAGTYGMPFWQALASGGQLAAPEMSFWFTRFIDDPDSDGIGPGGVFTLGGRNSSLFRGDVDFVDMPTSPQQPNAFWRLSMIRHSAKKASSGQSALSTIDTGADMIGGPREDVTAIWNAVSGAQPVDDMPGYWAFPCSTKVYISLSFGSKLWPINPADISRGPLSTYSYLCLGVIFDLSSAASELDDAGWIIGTPFLKNMYSVFRMDPPSIGFAQGSGTLHFPTAPQLTSSLRLSDSASSPMLVMLSEEETKMFARFMYNNVKFLRLAQIVLTITLCAPKWLVHALNRQ